jgi:hypothetical protein
MSNDNDCMNCSILKEVTESFNKTVSSLLWNLQFLSVVIGAISITKDVLQIIFNFIFK